MENKKKIRVLYASAVYGKEEIEAVKKVLSNPLKIGAGHAVKEFEKQISELFEKKYGIMVNSGSSANLLIFELLNFPKGSEIITPILTFGTTLAPIVQKGLVPVFIDIDHGTYVINANQIESMISDKTKALMIPSLFGNVPDLEKIRKIADKHNLFFIEDSCDTLGSKFQGKSTGAYSDASTSSFYASHIITGAGGGGILCVDDPILAKRALVMSNWGRESTLFGVYEESEEINKRFSGKLDGKTYDSKFIFSEVGYNFQPTEIQGAFAVEQLKRFPIFKQKRQKIFLELISFFEKYSKFFILPKQDLRVETIWLAFPLTIKDNVCFSRTEITEYLEEKGIQTRPVFTGNVLKHPAFENIESRTIESGYPVTDSVMNNSFVIGCHNGLEEYQINYLKEMFSLFLKRYK
ncbi:aminotransferase class I/II-fold pyridoxal phosphate-dependent enzyme [Candidatus Parcubacteria bacterium]|nr:aminotransferase class I/II-fold pyridoxal phosphate-dependent enzyme [Candidatus Parcubacteria bacterium]